ncbi:MAG: hypothetical protein AAGF11_20805 [Myxococcota bacterium]
MAFGIGAWLGCDPGAFQCQDDTSCVFDNQQGTCQESGYCSFPDGSCDSGQRYGQHVGEMLAYTCVELPELDDGLDADPQPNPRDAEEVLRDPEDPDDPGTDPDADAESTDRVECWFDPFDDSALEFDWCADLPPGIEATEQGDMLHFDLLPDQWEGGEQIGQIRNCAPLPLLDLTATVRVEQIPSRSRYTEGYLEVGNAAFSVGIGVTDDHLYAYVYEGESVWETPSQHYSPDEHRYWRVRGTPEGLVAEVSPDGTTWEHLHTHVDDLQDEWGQAMLGVWSDRKPTLPDAAVYDWLQVCGVPG